MAKLKENLENPHQHINCFFF